VRDFRDLALDDCCLALVAAHERIHSLEQDVASYRALAQEAIHALHRQTQTLNRVREQYQRLLEDHRRLRRELEAA
jgi:hypothetical protein